MVVVDPVQDVVVLLKKQINYENIGNTEDNLNIDTIYENQHINLANGENILLYYIDGNRDYSDYFNNDSWHFFADVAVQISARTRNNTDTKMGIYPLKDAVSNVFERFLNWKQVDSTSNFNHVFITSEQDLSDKRVNFSKYVINIKLECIGVRRRTV